MLRLGGHLSEVDRYVRLSSKQRLLLLGLLLLMLYHIIACVHFSITYLEGFSPVDEAWLPSDDIYLEQLNDTHFQSRNNVVLAAPSATLTTIAHQQYFRSLYYAANVLAALGKTIEPASDAQYAIAVVLMLSGFLITAVVVDNVQKRFTASAFEQKAFFATRTRIQLFLRRQRAPLALHHRVSAFLDFWWSAHRGATISELLADLPPSLRRSILHSICAPVLQTLALVAGVRTVLEPLEDVMVENVRFVLYGQGEIVYRQGDYAAGVFFLLEGDVCVITAGHSLRGVPLGGFFGTASLEKSTSTDGYGEHVSATSSCILLFVANEHLRAMERLFPPFPVELLALEKRLLGHKLAKVDVGSKRDRPNGRLDSAESPARGVFARWFSEPTALDPDASYVFAWETWLFVVMTVQWITVLFQICFRTEKGTTTTHHRTADSVTSSLEIWFLLDVYVRSRLGYYEYGNKVLALTQIRRTYFRSATFALDLLALAPLYALNWRRDAADRLDIVNLNKLLRLFKVPQQFRALETRFLKFSMELRLLRLVYYTFMLTHIFGCIWFDFATNASHLNLAGTSASATESHLSGDDEPSSAHWLPPARLLHGEPTMQYAGSLFWAFGLMSASHTGELPKTTPQCVFSVVTMTAGFFLFAYVIGNFMDILELMDAENREFNAKMGSVRLLLTHFKLPTSLEDRLKTFFFFKRYHSITQEHVLERCLPPSLLTDIRLVHLQPMIAKVAFLSGMEGSVTRMLVSQFNQVIVLRGQFVCRYGEEGSDMFFVFTGVLDVLLPSDDSTGDNNRKHSAATGATGPLLKKVNEISSGSYFGENGLFTTSRRNAHVCAQTSCILYKLSRESLELVFERYPAWKLKVIRIANLQHEQQRLNRLSQAEQLRHTDEDGGAMLSKMDVLNQRAEAIEEELQLVRIRRSSSARVHVLVRPSHTRRWHECVRDSVLMLLRKLLTGAKAQSALHLVWLRMMVACTVYVAIIVPYQTSIDALERPTPLVRLAKSVELVCELLFVADIWFSVHVQSCPQSMELYEQAHAVVYKKDRLLWDIVAAVPVYQLALEFSSRVRWLRLLHCAKVVNIQSYMGELNRRSVSYELDRARGVWLLYMLVMFWVACAYLSLSTSAGYGDDWDAWMPSTAVEIADPDHPQSHELGLRLCRGLFYAVTAFVKKGHTFVPESSAHYIFSILCSFFGLLVMSFMIGEIASLFISYIGVEVDFRRSHIAVELYLARLNVSSTLKTRAHAFMFSLWSSHSGVNYETVFQEISPPIRTACALHIAQQPLDWFLRTVFRPLSVGTGASELERITHSIARELHFEGYPRDETILAEGSIARAMYFVVKGHLYLQSNTYAALLHPVGLRAGDYFGERGLLGCAVSTYSVRTIRACDLLSLTSERLLTVIHRHAFARLALLVAQASYRKLQAEVTSSCPPNVMEELWGHALASVLHSDQLESESHACRSPRRGAAGGREPRLASSPPAVCSDEVEEEEADSVDRVRTTMRDLLHTPSECYTAFQGILQIIVPNDPLDWHASFGRAAQLATVSSVAATSTASNIRVESARTANRDGEVPKGTGPGSSRDDEEAQGQVDGEQEQLGGNVSSDCDFVMSGPTIDLIPSRRSETSVSGVGANGEEGFPQTPPARPRLNSLKGAMDGGGWSYLKLTLSTLLVCGTLADVLRLSGLAGFLPRNGHTVHTEDRGVEECGEKTDPDTATSS